MKELNKKKGFEKLNIIASKQGYITIDDILDYANEVDLPLYDVDKLCGELQDKGIIILEEDEESNNNSESGTVVDKSRLDYEEIFNRVISIDPSLEEYINELRTIPPPQTREESTLIGQAKDGNPYARDRIIKMYLKIVVKMALYHFDKYSLPLAETIQDGNVGLLRALDKIPDSCDQRFSTYAPWWIRQSIQRKTLGLTNNFYFPHYLKQKLFDLAKVYKEHFCSECLKSSLCPMLIEEISNKIDLDKKTVEQLIIILKRNISIDEYILKDGSDRLFSDNRNIEYEMIEEVYKSQFWENAFASLKKREAAILKYRYGINDGREMTLENIGKIYNVTRERIRQIEAKAIKKLRCSKKLRYFNV